MIKTDKKGSSGLKSKEEIEKYLKIREKSINLILKERCLFHKEKSSHEISTSKSGEKLQPHP